MKPVATTRTAAQRLLVFVPARRNWTGGPRSVPGPATVVDYLAVEADGALHEGTAAVGALPRSRALDLVFDGLDVYTATIVAPALGEARLRQALPNLLEDRMLADPADYHFASAPAPAATVVAGADGVSPGDNLLSVSAIDRATLSRTLEAFAQAQLTPRAAFSELYVVPAPDAGNFCARIAAGRGLLRSARDQGCVFDADAGAVGTLALAIRQFSIDHLTLYGRAQDLESAGITELCTALAGAAPGVRITRVSAMADPDAATDTVNLLQGAFVTSGGFGFSGRLLSRLTRDGAWKAPAAWLAVCAAVAIGGLNAYWIQLDGRFQDQRTSMHRVFRDGFPNEPDAYLLEQARRSVALLRARAGRPSADDFSVLNAQALQLLATAPAGIVAAIEYTDSLYRIRFKPGAAADPALRNTLQARGPVMGLTVHFDADGSARLTPLGK
jgi:general secretion pathway protein L